MNLGRLFGVLVLIASAVPADAQSLVDWTQAPGRLGLGYPVPIPVDTPLPFDGFRSYAGLHARHQSLELDHEAIVGEVIGQTVLGRDIWLYAFGDPDRPDGEGRTRPAFLLNGGIHAREWQSPEVVTGLMELLADGQDDGHWLSWLRDNASIVMIPVLNIDGFLQTQRYPRSNWLDSDPQSPAGAPRDGRMRRKNHRGADEDLFSAGDHLNGVDLNRNSEPFWPGPPGNALPHGLLYLGVGPGSEAEIQALQAAGARLPANALRFYSDMHSFGKVMFAVDTGNARRRQVQTDLLGVAIQHHFQLPGQKLYRLINEAPLTGIGTTSEYFAHIFKVPSLTWELEPGNGAVEYGGFGTNGHDGFILPESQIRRVRDNMALTLAATAYHMAGPPHLRALQVFDESTGALIVANHWALPGASSRQLDRRAIAALVPGRSYRLWLAYSKPMRWRDAGGQVVAFPGQSSTGLDVSLGLSAGGATLDVDIGVPTWLDALGGSPAGYLRYRDDAFSVLLTVRDTPDNRSRIQSALAVGAEAMLAIDVRDMTGRRLDADPATPVDFRQGAWSGYQGDGGVAGDVGGIDRTQRLPISLTPPAAPFPVDPGHSATWYDARRDGEGFVLEILDGASALLYWFTYDESGGQRWLTALGAIDGNRIRFPELVATTGGRFGPAFDPAAVERRVVGSGELWFHDCERGWFDYDAFDQRGSFQLTRTSRTMGIDCADDAEPGLPEATQSGSWFDPAHNGEGYALQWMTSGRVIMTWYSFDSDGNPYWMLGVGDPVGDEIVFPDVHATRGARFGAGFDPAAVERLLWGEVRMRLGCEIGEANYDSVLPDFGSGSFQLQRLTGLAGLGCAPVP